VYISEASGDAKQIITVIYIYLFNVLTDGQQPDVRTDHRRHNASPPD